jgi:hypothetical protein
LTENYTIFMLGLADLMGSIAELNEEKSGLNL